MRKKDGELCGVMVHITHKRKGLATNRCQRMICKERLHWVATKGTLHTNEGEKVRRRGREMDEGRRR